MNHRPLRIVYAGDLTAPWVGTSLQRMDELQRNGCVIVPVDSRPFFNPRGFIARVFNRLHFGHAFDRCNRLLLEVVTGEMPDIVWIDKGIWVFPRTLREIKARAKPVLVHYTPDAGLIFNRFDHPNRSRHFRKCITYYDLLVTTKAYEIDAYKSHGAKKLLLQPPTFDRALHKPEIPTEAERRAYSCDLIFIGTYARGRERFLGPLAKTDVDLAIWGSNWENCRDPVLRQRWKGSDLKGREYSVAICCSKIGLGLLSPLVPDQATTRSMEIPACKTLLLAQRTTEHLQLFKEGIEAEFFDSFDELLTKTKRYLLDNVARERIATAGRERCLNSGYSTSEQVRMILSEVQCETYSFK